MICRIKNNPPKEKSTTFTAAKCSIFIPRLVSAKASNSHNKKFGLFNRY